MELYRPPKLNELEEAERRGQEGAFHGVWPAANEVIEFILISLFAIGPRGCLLCVLSAATWRVLMDRWRLETLISRFFLVFFILSGDK